MILDDFLFLIIVAGFALACAYLQSEYALHARSKAAERSKMLVQRDLRVAKAGLEQNGISVRVRIIQASLRPLTIPIMFWQKEDSMFTKKTVLKLALLMAAATVAIAQEPVSFTSFDIPGATNYFVAGISDEGVVAGTWFPAGGSDVGFVRYPDGRISSSIVDPDDNSGVTVLRAIDDEGVIAGFYGANVSNGFLLTNGRFRTVDFPGAVSTALRGINNLGDVSGTYSIVDLNADEFGFIIPRRGPAISFKLPDPTATGIVVGGINDLRQLVGYYTDATSTLVGFLRQPGGQFVSVIFPGALSTQVFGINDCGIVIGVWGDGSTAHGFYGRPGNLRSFDLPGAAATFAQGINNEGRIVGRYATTDGVPHAFVSGRLAAASCL